MWSMVGFLPPLEWPSVLSLTSPCPMSSLTMLETVGGVIFVSLAISALEIGSDVLILLRMIDLFTDFIN